MNKSTILNITMAIAIVTLYILHFTGNTSVNKTGVIKVTPRVNSRDSGKIDLPVAYVDMDSLNEKITYFKKMRKQFEAEQGAIEKEWENGYRGLENQKNSFLQKGESITQAEAEAFQQKLYEQKQQIGSEIVDAQDLIDDIRENPEGDYDEDQIEEAIDSWVDDNEDNFIQLYKDMGGDPKNIVHYTDTKGIIDTVMSQDGYGTILGSYDGEYEEIDVENETYIVFRYN